MRYVKDGGNSRGERKTAVCCIQAVRGYFENYYESRCQVTSPSQRSSRWRENEKIQAMFPRVSLCFVSLLPQRWSRAVLVSLFTRLHDPALFLNICALFFAQRRKKEKKISDFLPLLSFFFFPFRPVSFFLF